MTETKFIHTIETYLPKQLVSLYRNQKRSLLWYRQQVYNKIAVSKIKKKKGPLRVIFLVAYSSIWKYDSVFKSMQNDPMFCPIILLCPCLLQDEQSRAAIMKANIEYFRGRGYEVYSAQDMNTGEYIPISSFSPDIIFYTRSYKNEINKKYDVYHTAKYLKCYVNYGFNNVPFAWGVANAFHGLMWKRYIECEENRLLALSFEPKEARNTIVTGYPIYDEFLDLKGDLSMWKKNNPKFKRIIWAPHHTIEGQTGMLQLSTFLLYSDIMLQIAEEYVDKVQFVFKPHPLLKSVLYRHPSWGKEKTDCYYSKWATGENTSYVDGSYVELFGTSDALIHDCGSFTIEYLYTQKPCLYLSTYDKTIQSNEVAKRAFDAHYHGYSAEDIKRFINEVILNENDTMITIRKEFYNEVLSPPNNCSVAENILNDIKMNLGLL